MTYDITDPRSVLPWPNPERDVHPEAERSARRYMQRYALLVDGVLPNNPWGDWRVLPEDAPAEFARRGVR